MEGGEEGRDEHGEEGFVVDGGLGWEEELEFFAEGAEGAGVLGGGVDGDGEDGA